MAATGTRTGSRRAQPPGAALPYRFAIDDLARMVDAGILHEDDRVELLSGQVVTMAPIGEAHAAAVGQVAARRQHQHRQPRARHAQFAQQLEAAAAGQHHIEDHEVGFAGGQPGGGGIRVADAVHIEAFAGEVLAEHAGELAVVIDDQDMAGHGVWRLR